MPLSDKEKQVVQNMKNQLNMMGVPRHQWAPMIQKELHNFQKEQKKHNKIKNRSSISKTLHRIFNRVKNMFRKTFTKLLMKKQGINMSDGEMDMITQMMSGNTNMGNINPQNLGFDPSSMPNFGLRDQDMQMLENMDETMLLQMMNQMMGGMMPNNFSEEDLKEIQKVGLDIFGAGAPSFSEKNSQAKKKIPIEFADEEDEEEDH